MSAYLPVISDNIPDELKALPRWVVWKEQRVVGKTDKIAGTVVDRPVSPKDILATLYHLLGIDPHTTLRDRTGRPVPLVADGEVIAELLA